MRPDPIAVQIEYREHLERYLEWGGEESLQQAYQLGRRALAQGLGIVGLSALHDRILAEILRGAGITPEMVRLIATIQSFFVESLTPYEMALQSSREASAAWRQLNERLETEAKRIAHALHDEAGQLLATAHISLSELAGELPPAKRRRLEEVRHHLREVEEQLRRISRELRPTILDYVGILPALEFMAEGVSRRGEFAAKVEGRIDRRLPALVEIVLYRVVQEALTNVARHARATRASVRILQTKEEVQCVVEDDGIGFEPSRLTAAGAGGGLGLLGMKERLAAVGGTLLVASRHGGGTELSVRIPLGGEDGTENSAGR